MFSGGIDGVGVQHGAELSTEVWDIRAILRQMIELAQQFWWIGAIVAGVLAVPFLLIALGLLKNWPMLWNPPGVRARLSRYLTRNVVETSADPYWLELQVRHFRTDEQATIQGIADTLEALGWEVVSVDEEKHEAKAIVRSLIFRFKDDVRIWVRESARTNGVSVHMRSESRIGRGDLGANAKHVLKFYAKLSDVLGIPGRI